ncbi:hypothetical protein CDD83_9663 [Cordyceps sp. RAO-2017]|nr:hypothetical protein CDD83_9663 [Cordyceps sp. RAO-2017]
MRADRDKGKGEQRKPSPSKSKEKKWQRHGNSHFAESSTFARSYEAGDSERRLHYSNSPYEGLSMEQRLEMSNMSTEGKAKVWKKHQERLALMERLEGERLQNDRNDARIRRNAMLAIAQRHEEEFRAEERRAVIRDSLRADNEEAARRLAAIFGDEDIVADLSDDGSPESGGTEPGPDGAAAAARSWAGYAHEAPFGAVAQSFPGPESGPEQGSDEAAGAAQSWAGYAPEEPFGAVLQPAPAPALRQPVEAVQQLRFDTEADENTIVDPDDDVSRQYGGPETGLDEAAAQPWTGYAPEEAFEAASPPVPGSVYRPCPVEAAQEPRFGTAVDEDNLAGPAGYRVERRRGPEPGLAAPMAVAQPWAGYHVPAAIFGAAPQPGLGLVYWQPVQTVQQPQFRTGQPPSRPGPSHRSSVRGGDRNRETRKKDKTARDGSSSSLPAWLRGESMAFPFGGRHGKHGGSGSSSKATAEKSSSSGKKHESRSGRGGKETDKDRKRSGKKK